MLIFIAKFKICNIFASQKSKIMSSFQDQCLIIDRIETVIRENLEGSSLDISKIQFGKSYKFRFPKNNPPTASLNVLELNTGKVTLFYGQGKNPDFSKKVAEKIIENCSYVELPFNQLVLGTITSENFDFLNSTIAEYATLESETDIVNGKQLKYRGRQGDIISINRYNNNTLHIQGRPSLLFTQLIEPLSLIYPKNEFIVNLCGYFHTEVNQAEIEREYLGLNPNANNLVNENLQGLIQTSIAISKVHINGLSDYSYITFPILKALEGLIKDILSNHGIIIGIEGFNCFDKNQTTGIYSLKPDSINQINNNNTESIVCTLYNYFNRTRHRIFHYDPLLPQTLSHVEALGIINSTIEIIENCCTQQA